MRGIKAREVLEAALDAAGWQGARAGPHHGRGIGLFGRQIGGGAGGAILTAEPDGTLTLISPTLDQGMWHAHDIGQQLVAARYGRAAGPRARDRRRHGHSARTTKARAPAG